MRQADIAFAVTVLLSALNPPSSKHHSSSSSHKMHHLSVSDIGGGRSGSVGSSTAATATQGATHKRHGPKESVQTVVFLG